MRIYFPSLLAILLLVSCKSQEKVKPSAKAPAHVENHTPQGPSPELKNLGAEDVTEPQESSIACLPMSQSKLIGAEDIKKARILDANQISANCMMLQVQYSGCNEGDYHLVRASDSDPSIFELKVAHAGACEMLIEMMIYFDLKSLGLAPGPQNIWVSGLEIPVELP